MKIRQNAPIILASTSPYRKEVLEKSGVKFKALPPLDDEEELKAEISHLDFAEQALKLAIHKGVKLSLNHPEAYILCADQIGACNNKVYGKSHTKENAIKALKELSGKTITLYTSAAVLKDGKKVWSTVEKPSATYRKTSENEIRTYVHAENGVEHVAGSCKIEGLGIHLLKEVNGDRNTIIGLPLPQILTYFYEHKILELV